MKLGLDVCVVLAETIKNDYGENLMPLISLIINEGLNSTDKEDPAFGIAAEVIKNINSKIS